MSEQQELFDRTAGKRCAEFKLMQLRDADWGDTVIDTPERVAEFWRANVPNSAWYADGKEICVCLWLNTRRKLTGFNLISLGTLDTLLVHPREVYRPALIAGASAIILAHNHPSGDPTPSEADIKVTRDMIRAGQLLKVDLLDHIVIGRPDHRSLRELGYFFV